MSGSDRGERKGKERRIWLLSWREFKEALEDTDLVILPMGVNEAHGNHLPLGTDFLIPEWMAEQLADDLNALIAPPIRYGVVTGLSGYWGSLSISESTLEALTYDVLSELAENGFERVIILNGHGGSGQVRAVSNAMGRAWRELGLRSVMVMWWEVWPELSSEIFGGAGGHAGVDETAMIMAVDEGLVKGEMDEDEVYRLMEGIRPTPMPGSILSYNDEFIAEIPDPEKAKEFARRILERVRREIERILEGWDRQDSLLR